MAIGHKVQAEMERRAGDEAVEMAHDTLDPAVMRMIAATVAAAMAPVVEAIGALVAGQHEAAADAMKMAKQGKRAESYKGDFVFPSISHFTPLGVIDGPALPALRCKTWLGVYWVDEGTDEIKIDPGFECEADEYGGCTFEERRLLNNVQPGVYKLKRRDGMTGNVRVQFRYDTDGQPERIVIAVPKAWMTRQTKNQIGSLVEIAGQLQPETAIKATIQDRAA